MSTLRERMRAGDNLVGTMVNIMSHPDIPRILQSCGFDTIASGDSFNDLAMIRASKAGFLFRSPAKIQADNPDIPACEEYDELLALIKNAMQ